MFFFFFQAEDGIRDGHVTGVQTCALPISRQMFLGTMIVFTIGTVICASAQIFPVLLVGRLIQAVGSGLLIPIIFNTFLLIFPQHRRGAVMGIVGQIGRASCREREYV